MLFTLRVEQSSFKFVPNKFSQQQKKSNQKNAATTTTPLKIRGTHWDSTVIMLWKNSQRTLRQFSQKAHDNCTASMVCWSGKKSKTVAFM